MDSLAKSVETCQAAFNHLELASTNPKDRDSALLSSKFDEIKRSLKSEGVALIRFLREILVLGDELILQLHGGGSTADGEGRTEAVAEAMEGLKNAARVIIDLHSKTRETFVSHEETISKILSARPSSVRVAKQMGTMSGMTKTVAESPDSASRKSDISAGCCTVYSLQP